MSYINLTETQREKCICGHTRFAHTQITEECIICDCKKFKIKLEEGQQ